MTVLSGWFRFPVRMTVVPCFGHRCYVGYQAFMVLVNTLHIAMGEPFFDTIKLGIDQVVLKGKIKGKET